MSALDTTKADLTLPAVRPPVRRSTPRQPPGLGGPTIPALLRALGRRWQLALTLPLLGGLVTALALWYFLPQRHAAELWLRIGPPPHDVLAAMGDASDLAEYRQAQAARIRSPQLLAAALEQDAAAAFRAAHGLEEGRLRLEKALTVTIDPEQGILRLRVTAATPAQAAALVDAVAGTYLQDLRQQRQDYLHRLNAAADQERTELRRVRQQAAALHDPQREILTRDWQQAQFELARARTELKLAQERAKELRPPLSPAALATAADEYLRSDNLAQDYRRQLDRLEESSRAWAKVTALGDSDPRLRDYAEKRQVLRKKLEERHKAAWAAAQRQVAERAQAEQHSRLQGLRDRIAALEKLEATRKEQLRQHEPATAEALRLRELRDETAQRHKELDRLQTEVRAVEREGKGPAWVSHLGQSQTAPAESRQLRLRRAGLGGGFAFAFLLLAISWQEFRVRRITNNQDIVYGLGLTLAGTLPKVPEKLLRTVQSSSPAEEARLHEAVDVLRTLVLRTAADRPCVVLVTSAAEGEGKTSLATQLALSLARAWRKTLLIDGDLRKPVLHQRFNRAAEPGFSEMLRFEFDPTDMIHPTEIARLWVLTAGHADSHALQALAQEDSRALFAGLKEQYDFVVLDASSVLSVADAVLLSQHADIVLLAARSGRSNLRAVHTAQERLATVGAAPLGVVLVETPA
jgi:succinoglycan biosynthesis transport protein ExoP